MQTENKETDPLAGMVRVVFTIEKSTLDATAEHVHIVGSVPGLGEWDVNKAKMVGYSGLNNWIAEEYFEPFTEVDFNLCLLRFPKRDLTFSEGDDTDGIKATLVHREDGWTRRLQLTDVSLHLRMTYNSEDVKVTELRSTLTQDGRPVRLFQENTEINFTPRPGGWDFTERENRMKNRYFDRVETSVMNGQVFTTIKQSLVQQRLREDYVRLQKEAMKRQEQEAELDKKVTSVNYLSIACQAESVAVDKEPDNVTDILADTRTLRRQMTREDAAVGTRKRKTIERKMRLKKKKDKRKNKVTIVDHNRNVVKIKQEDTFSHEERVPDKNGHSGWSRALKVAAPLGLGLGTAAVALFFWFRQK